MSETATAQVLGEARTNTRKDTVVDVLANIDEALLLFDPARNQLVEVTREHAKEFLEEANRMKSLAQRLVEARQKVLELSEQFDEAANAKHPSLERLAILKEQIAEARKKYDTVYDEIKENLGDQGYLSTKGDGKELIELIPLARRKGSGAPKEWGRKWTYVRSDKMKNHLRAYKLSKVDSAVEQGESFVRNGRIDPKQLGKQFGKLDTKVKNEWFKAHDAGYLFPNLQVWADTLNQKASEALPARFKPEISLFRYFAGCGAGSEWKPLEGKMSGKLNGSAELMLAHGECKTEGFAPNEHGWVLGMVGAKSGTPYHIGAIRLAGSLKVEGAVGASVAAELSVEVDYSSMTGKPSVKGARRPKKSTGTPKRVRLDVVDAGVNAGGDAFAGIKVGGEVTGAIQYKSPEKNQQFEDIAKVGPKVDVMFGAGAAASFVLDFRDGRFRFKVKAGLCFGPGAKGELGLEVDVNQIASFMQWFFHALLNAGFEFVEVVTDDAYKAAMRLQVMMVKNIKSAYENMDLAWDQFKKSMAREAGRVELMNRVIKSPDILRHCAPEAHGILLWELSRHGKLTKSAFLWQNSEDWEVLGRRKRAIMQILEWQQCRSQFNNTVQHMHPEGRKGDFNTNMTHLLNFMEIGPGDSDYDQNLWDLYTGLPETPPKGYPVVLNTTHQFWLNAKFESTTYLAQMRAKTEVIV
ncbi:hypothetical protein G3580_07245 [Nitrogeniibacter mangrovi]|uniref:Uncharacterized protein n=1 Tax=Nitrogeniibacter mangrovi TaxID=2016596 RepID=A0A6C1B3N5_9RHOO|nr:hypothetical protein [Nitrogeniibacter mangrovi]QID17458.1 hypothetical protein G3580_07245 [Nitrogeniibacter mangrovi]